MTSWKAITSLNSIATVKTTKSYVLLQDFKDKGVYNIFLKEVSHVNSHGVPFSVKDTFLNRKKVNARFELSSRMPREISSRMSVRKRYRVNLCTFLRNIYGEVQNLHFRKYMSSSAAMLITFRILPFESRRACRLAAGSALPARAPKSLTRCTRLTSISA